MAAELVRPGAPATTTSSASTGLGCGSRRPSPSRIASAVAAVALAPPARAPAPEALAFLLFVGSSVHVASTGWFYTVPEVRAHMRQQPARYVWWPLALISGAGAIAFLLPRPTLLWLLLPYFGWQFFHYQKQNLGIAALTASSLQRAVAAGPASVAR